MIHDTLATFTTVALTTAEVAGRIDARKGRFWVAVDATDTAQGFVTFGPFRSGPGYAATVEHTIILDRTVQGAGLGHALMALAETGARDLGHHVMVAAISSANPAAIRFHTSRGFVQTGHLPQVGRKADQWLDLILMQKVISAR